MILVYNSTLKMTDQNVRSKSWRFKECTSTYFDDNLLYNEHLAKTSRILFSEKNTSD